MNYAEPIDALELQTIRFNEQDPKQIHHLMKVHRFAQMIGRRENLDAHTQFVTECAALVHDIGIRPAREKYGDSNGKLQEKEGPAYARKMLNQRSVVSEDIDRICYLVARHHTYTQIDGIDYQILVEADSLVNFYENHLEPSAVQSAYAKIFRTSFGKQLCQTIYPLF